MGETAIEWTSGPRGEPGFTFNPWIGCQEVSPACDNCYARVQNEHRQWVKGWGPHGERRLTSNDNWKKPLAWDRAAVKSGQRFKVFCASLADVFDTRVPMEWRVRLWCLINSTPNLDWLLLTKRPQNIKDMLPASWGTRGYPNVWLGTTVENQQEADRRIPALLGVPATIHFLSCEPLLGEVDITQWVWGVDQPCEGCPKDVDCECGWRTRKENGLASIDWVIVGGESGGPPERRLDLKHAASLLGQCQQADVPFFGKQDNKKVPLPEYLMVREWPTVAV